jgi:hypothetical protein
MLEVTPDPHGPFWVTTAQAVKLLPRIASAGSRRDPALYQILLDQAGQ